MSIRQNRGGRKDTSERKASAVEAAYVVESYLIEHNYSKTLAEFRSEAATTLSTLKTAPKAVKSVSSVLHEYLIVREENQASIREKLRLEQALKDEQAVLVQERNRIQLLVQQLHDSLAVYHAGGIPRSSPVQPSFLSSPVPPLHMLPAGHSTPPGAGIGPGLTRTPTSAGQAVNAIPSTNNKRKIAVRGKSVQGVSAPDSVAPNSTASTKKARQHSLPSGSPLGVQPFPMCGTVRKTSLNMVRPVQSKSARYPPPAAQDHNSLHSTPSLPVPQHDMPSKSPLPTSKSVPSATRTQPLEPAPLARPTSSVSSSTTGPKNLQIQNPNLANPDPKTPPQNAASYSSEHDRMGPKAAQNSHPSEQDPGETCRILRSSTGPASAQPLEQNPPPIQPSGVGCLPNSSHGEDGGGAREVSSTSPDSCTYASTRGMKPSKTMRPLNFSSTKASCQEASVSPAVGFKHESPAGSDELVADLAISENNSPVQSSDGDYGSIKAGEEILPQLSADLESIDDILACLDDASFSELVGDILSNDVCGVDALPSAEFDKNRSLIGEDSFGFHCMLERVNSQDNLPPCGNVLSERNVNARANDDSVTGNKSPVSPSKSSPLRSGTAGQQVRQKVDKENAISTR